MNIEKLKEVLTEALTKEWEAQGHSMTGKMVQTIDYVVKEEVDRLTLSGMIYPYGNYIAHGARWPNKRPPIEPLQRWVQLRMNINDEKKSKSIAFAIATDLKKKGLPLPGTEHFSSTGKRTEWVSDAFKNEEDKITETVRDMVYDVLLVNFNSIIDKWNILLNTN